MSKHALKIGKTPIGPEHPPYVIAEIGSNFDQSLDTARRLIDVALEAGANAVKFQLFQADVLYPDGGELHDIFRSIQLDPDWLPELSRHAGERDLHFMASAFDVQSVDRLEAVSVPAHKVASSETTNIPLLHHIAATGKPVLVSTGMCDMVDVEEAVNVCRGLGNDQVVLMQCGAMYPLPPNLANLRVISLFEGRFDFPTGFSDHTLGNAAAATAVGLGASVFEKHITLDRNGEGPDHSYACEPEPFKTYVAGIREAHAALGVPVKEMLPQEREQGRREGIYAGRAMDQGEVIRDSDIIIRRPALGLRARYRSFVVGATLSAPVAKDDPLNWDMLSFGSVS